MRIECPPLPFAYDALEPQMSAETLKLHHDKHQRAYFDKLCGLIEGTELADLDLETIIASTAKARAGKQKSIFNNAAQLWNHTFFWHSIAPPVHGQRPAAPQGDLHDHIERDFGGLAEFRDAFATAARNLFGSGWVWLAQRKGKLEILPLSNAGTPIADGASRPLLTLDVWEHAYYVDHRNQRDRFVDDFLDHLVNWDFAAERFRLRSAKFDPAAHPAKHDDHRAADASGRA